MMNPRAHSIKRLITAIVADLLVLGVFLGGFTFFYFLRERSYSPKQLSSSAPVEASATESPAESQTSATPTQVLPSPTPEVVDTGLLGGKYADKFTSGEVEQTDTSYKSANVSIEITKNTAGTESKPVVYYIADIYIKDINSLRTGVAMDYKDQNKGERKNVMSTLLLSQFTKSLVAISGDNFAFHDGIVVRNGIEWQKILPVYGDICVLYYDGTMETYSQKLKQTDVDAIYAKKPYQIWTFGPQLLVDGQVPTRFANGNANPLSAIGYYEPGHYCFILVDGRQKDYSWGLSHAQLAQIFYDLGCKVAFNLDGGDTAVMTYMGQWRSQPEASSPRDTSDIIYIIEPSPASGQ